MLWVELWTCLQLEAPEEVTLPNTDSLHLPLSTFIFVLPKRPSSSTISASASTLAKCCGICCGKKGCMVFLAKILIASSGHFVEGPRTFPRVFAVSHCVVLSKHWVQQCPTSAWGNLIRIKKDMSTGFITNMFRYLKWRVSWALYKAILGVGFPLHKPYPYSLYRWSPPF